MADAGGRQRHLKILVVAPAWVGDMVMSHCLVRVLLARYPGAAVHLLAPPATAALGARMPGVACTHVLEAGHGELALGERFRLGRRLVREGFDLAIVLPSSFKSALVPFWARIPRRRGYTGELRYGLLNERRRLLERQHRLAIERFMALGLDAGVLLDKPYPRPALRADAAGAARLAAAHGLEPAGAVAFCPGAAYGPAKRWPAGHFAAVARALVAEGRQVWLLGGPGDADVCAEIECEVPRGIVNLAGKISLLDAVDVLSLATDAVTNDSGLMHVACALGVQVTAIYGSSSPDFTPPLSDAATVLRLELPCSPCFQRECPLGHRDCLVKLEPQRVVECLHGRAA